MGRQRERRLLGRVIRALAARWQTYDRAKVKRLAKHTQRTSGWDGDA